MVQIMPFDYTFHPEINSMDSQNLKINMTASV